MIIRKNLSSNHGGPRVIGTTMTPPPRFKPTRDRAIPVRSVPCPVCKAEIGSPCVTAAGKQYANGTGHPSRRRMAIRRMREEGETS